MRQPSLEVPTRRALFAAAALTVSISFPVWHQPANAALVGETQDELASNYAAGMRATGGRGANALFRSRAESGVQRIGGSPVFVRGRVQTRASQCTSPGLIPESFSCRNQGSSSTV